MLHLYPLPIETSTDILELISGGLRPTVHWYSEDVPLSQLTATMVGMANSGGGTILLGVSPRAGELIGVNNLPGAIDKVFQAAICSEPSLVLPLARQVIVQKPGMDKPVNLLLISVPIGLPHVYSFEGRYLGRQGSQNSPIPAPRLHQLMNERGALQFESRLISNAGVNDLDANKISAYAEAAGRVDPGNLVQAYDFLVKRGCLKQMGDKYQVTYAAMLLFGNYPQQWLPNATILAGRFPGPDMSDIYIKDEISGNLLDQLRQAEGFLRANLKTVVRLAGMTHQEHLEYPFEAVRELLVNAVAHRDYNQQGDNIHLNIYSDRLVVSSPGTLPGPVTLDNLLVARFARNVVISQVLSDLGYVERLGYGIDRVVELTRTEGMAPPQFEEVAGTFQATLFSSLPSESSSKRADFTAYANFELNPRQQVALTQLFSRHRITSHEFQALCPNVHAETLRRDLADLVSRGILIKIGDKKATYYILKRI